MIIINLYGGVSLPLLHYWYEESYSSFLISLSFLSFLLKLLVCSNEAFGAQVNLTLSFFAVKWQTVPLSLFKQPKGIVDIKSNFLSTGTSYHLLLCILKS